MKSIVATSGERPANFRSIPDTPYRAAVWWAPPGTPERTLERAALAAKCADETPLCADETPLQQRRRLDDLRGELAEVCAGVLGAGLRHRAGRYLVGVDRAVHDYLADGCPGHRTRGVSVCECCSLIFEHAYAVRALCDACHARPRRRAPLLSRDDAGAVFADPASGEVLFRFATCAHCGEPHYPHRPRAFCTDACRKREARGLAPPEDSLAARQAAVDEIERCLEDGAREREEAERADPALRAARVKAEHEAMARHWQHVARVMASPAGQRVAEQLATTGSLKDPPGYEPEPDTYRPRQRPCRKCAREGPWLSVCGPCGDSGAVPPRDGHACTHCGHTAGLAVHHVVSVADGGTNTLDNTITLCATCHHGAHGPAAA